MRSSVGAIRGRAVVGRLERLVKNRCDELQKLENQLGRAITGNFRSTNLGVVMAESGLRLAVSLLNNRSRRHVLRLMSLPKGDQAKSLPSYDTAMGQRMVHFSGYSGRVEEIFLPEDGSTELGANISIADAEWAEQEARRADSQPGLVLWTGGSRDENVTGRERNGMRTERWGTRWCGRRDGAGPGGRPTWGSFRTRSAPPLRVP